MEYKEIEKRIVSGISGTGYNFRQLRYEGVDYRELFKTINNNNNMDVLIKDKMNREYCPKSIEIIEHKRIDINVRNESIQDLLNWGWELVKKYSKEINSYIQYKKQFEMSLFTGDFNKAKVKLNSIEQEISYSLWSHQQRILILFLEDKREEVEIEIKRIKQESPNSLASILMQFYVKMADRQYSYSKYVETIENLLDTGEKTQALWKYFDYKLSINRKKELKGIKYVLVIDEQFSIIDYYESFIEAIIFLRNRKNCKYIIESIIKELYGNIEDYRIRNLYVSQINQELKELEEGFEFIDLYTKGEYEDLSKIWLEYDEKLYCDFSLYNIFVKSGINISNNVDLFKDLWEEIEKIYSFRYRIDHATEKLREYYKLLYITPWRYKILSVLTRKLNFVCEEEAFLLSVLHDMNLTPLFYQCIDGMEKKLIYLENYKNILPVTYSLQLYNITGKKVGDGFEKVEKHRKMFYVIKRLFEKKSYNECIKASKELLKYLENTNDLYYQERIRKILFQCYIKNEDMINSMETYVESYLIGAEHTSHMRLESLLPLIKETEDENIKKNICRPIILSLYYKAVEEEVIYSYFDYLESNDFKTINQYLEQSKDLDKFQIYFLGQVCTRTFLMKDYTRNKEITVAELRLEILNKIINCTEDNSSDYILELNAILKEEQLKNRSDSFNANRIFIDKENLFNYLVDDIEMEFSRYKIINEIRVIIGKNNYILSDAAVLSIYADEIVFFTSIVMKIVQAYLNESPFSLENFLSTRIRHNYCNDQLKKAFEEQNLFSKKENDNSEEYLINKYWEDKMNKEEYIEVQRELSTFSLAIDKKIKEIKSEWLRIKMNEGSRGMFDYTTFAYQFINYKESHFERAKQSPDEFVNVVIEELDCFTKKILDDIKLKIDEDLNNYYSKQLSLLETNIKKIDFDSKHKSEILAKIEKTKAKYPETINDFKEIFNLERSSYPNFNFNEVLDFCISLEKSQNKEFSEKNVTKEIDINDKYQGGIFPYLVDIFEILIKNAIQHSGLKIQNELSIMVKICKFTSDAVPKEMLLEVEEIGENEDMTIIILRNKLDRSIDIEKLNKKTREILDNISTSNYIDKSKSEGGSGLYKVARTIQYNLQSQSMAKIGTKIDREDFNIFLVVDLTRFRVKENME